MERFYPRMAQFARGEGYPCGNKGVFIPRRNKCWTHPKTGNRLTKPLTYQKYQEAKEKSQKSRTEAGRTALQNREQGFRDKAREKVKGWQNKAKEGEKVVVKPPVDIPSVDKPIGLEEVTGVVGRLNSGDITAKEAKAHYERIKNSGGLIKQELNKLNKNQLKDRYKGSLWSDTKKSELVDKVYTSTLKSFNLSGSLSLGLGAKDADIIKALDRAVDVSLTDENIQGSAVKTDAKTKAIKTEISNTLLKGVEKVKFDPKIEQKYQEIIAKTKDPKEAESVLLSALNDDTSWQNQKYRANEFARMIKETNIPESRKGFFQRVIDNHKPYADAEDFIEDRKKAISKGEYQNSVEAKAYLSKKIKDFDHDEYKYYDSPNYREDYNNLQLQITDKKLPPPVSGSMLKSNLGEALKPGDRLLVKEPIRDKKGRNIGFKGTESGEVLKSMNKTAQVRMTDKNKFVENWEQRVSLDSVSHVIRNGKRYKVDGFLIAHLIRWRKK